MNRINYYFMWNLKWNNHKAVTWEDTISGAGVVSRRTRSEWAERSGAVRQSRRHGRTVHAYVPHGSLTVPTLARRGQRSTACKHQKQNGHTWGWRLAPGALATWMSSPGEAARAGGAASPRGSTAARARALHRSAEPWLAPAGLFN